MHSSTIHTAGSAAATGFWPAVIFLGTVTVVTVIALCRAPRDDVSKIFAAFAAAFGFRRIPHPCNDHDHADGQDHLDANETEEPGDRGETA